MNRSNLKNYAPQARRDFIQAMTDRAAFYGLTAKKIEPVVEKGDVAVIGGRSHPRTVAKKRKKLEDRIKRHGFGPTMEALAYTWFNRLVAVRFMELHGYLDHGYRVLSSRPATDTHGKDTEESKNSSIRGSSVSVRGPEILEVAEHLELPKPIHDKVIDLKLASNKESELYRLLLLWQCNALHTAIPFLFERIDDETELLLPDNLLHSDSLIRKLVGEIDEEDWQEVEIIGWLYQFYISDKKDEVMGKVVASEDIPAATQLFTPNWIVKYLVQNTLGRQWLATYPQSALCQQMKYYIEPAEQTLEVQEQLKAITPTSLNPEELTLLDPACGSGHILVEAYDLFKAIYQERGYRAKDIPALILQKNLFGLEIDDRAAQLAAFALMMKARADDRRIFDSEAKPNIVALQEGLELADLKDVIPEDSDDYKGFAYLHATCRNAKTFGSLIQPVYKPNVLHPHFEQELKTQAQNDLFRSGIATHTIQLLRQHGLLMRQYDAVIANPPYMGGKYFAGILKDFVAENYEDAKADLYACFIQRNLAFAKPNGFVGMITIPNWMFLASFEDCRKSLFAKQTIDAFIHNGRGVFGSDFGSSAFSIRNSHLPKYRGRFRRLFDKQGSVASNEELSHRFFDAAEYIASSEDFGQIPGDPIAYWASPAARRAFGVGTALSKIATPTGGMTTGNNAKFVRYWHEVSVSRIGFGIKDRESASKSKKKWFPYNKGGAYRRWFGNNWFVVNWENDGHEIINSGAAFPRSKDYYFKESLTWTATSSSFFGIRYSDPGFIFDAKGSSCFPGPHQIRWLLGLLSSKQTALFLSFLNPTIEFQTGDIGDVPVLRTQIDSALPKINAVVDECIQIARLDWNSFEISWEFSTLPVILNKKPTLQQSQELANAEYNARFTRMKELEVANNTLFIEAYGLQEELSPEVPDDQITLYRPDGEEDTMRLLSYAIGCMMGRYSLDKPGLIYTQSGNQGFDPDQYKTFQADDDGIMPLLETEWGIRDDAANRIVEFIGVAWPKKLLEENLKFVADCLGPNNGEQPRDTIRRYLATVFYKHHLSMYKKRPIYWLFSSGKQRAFQCLVYLHRYHEGTLARMRTEYVIPLQGQIASRIEQLEGDKTKATSTSHRNKLQKEQNDLKKQQDELIIFEEKLKHAADKKISLDLDDGVKVNYGKFGDLLAEAKAICGAKEED